MGIKDRLAGKASTPGGSYGETVRFDEQGDLVAGVVTAVRRGITTKHGAADVIEVDDEERGEKISFFASNYQLRQALLEGENDLHRPVQNGDEVYIEYQGKVPTKNGNTVKTFLVAVEGPSASADEDVPF